MASNILKLLVPVALVGVGIYALAGPSTAYAAPQPPVPNPGGGGGGGGGGGPAPAPTDPFDREYGPEDLRPQSDFPADLWDAWQSAKTSSDVDYVVDVADWLFEEEFYAEGVFLMERADELHAREEEAAARQEWAVNAFNQGMQAVAAGDWATVDAIAVQLGENGYEAMAQELASAAGAAQ